MWNTDKRTGKSWAWFCCGIYDVAAADEVGEAGLASPEHAQLLQISEGSPIFIFSRTSYTAALRTSTADRQWSMLNPSIERTATRLSTA
jgi:UTRA domain